MGKRVKKALAGFAAAAATGDPAAIARNNAELAAYNAAEAKKKGGFLGHVLTKYSPAKLKNTIINPKVAFEDIGHTAKAGLRGSLKDKRANLRQHHALTIHPFDAAAQDTIKARHLMASSDPNVVARGKALQASVDANTMRQDKTGAAVGLVFLGASEVSGSTLSNVEAKAIAAAKTTIVKEVGAAATAKLAQHKRDAGNAAGGLAETSRSSNGQGMTVKGYSDASVSSSAWDHFIGWLVGTSQPSRAAPESSALSYPWWPRKV